MPCVRSTLASGSRQNQIEPLGIDGHLIHFEAVVVGLDRGPEFARGDPVVAEFDGVGEEAHLWRAKLQAGFGAELVALVEGQRLGHEAGRLQRNSKHGLQVRARDIHVDLASPADPSAEQRRLADEAEGARLEEYRGADRVDQLAGPIGLDRNRTHEGLIAEGHEEEALHLRRLTRLGVRPRLRLPERAHRVLHRARDAERGFEVVARRRQEDTEHQVAVAGRQIVESGQQQPRYEKSAAADHDRHAGGTQPAAHNPSGEGQDDAHEQRGKIVDDRQAKPVRRFLRGGKGRGGAAVFPASAPEDSARERGDHGARHDQRQDDRDRDGHGDVTEQLAGFQLHDQDRHEDEHRGRGRDEHRAPDLPRAVIGGLETPVTALPEPVDVLQHHDRRIHHHADGEGEARERDHVDRAPEKRHRHERAHDRDRDCDRNDQGRGEGAQEQQQDQRGQRATDENVLLHQIDGRIDVDGFVVDLFEDEPRLRDRRGIQFRHGLLYARHGLDHVGAGLAHRIDGQRGLAQQADARDGLLVAISD